MSCMAAPTWIWLVWISYSSCSRAAIPKLLQDSNHDKVHQAQVPKYSKYIHLLGLALLSICHVIYGCSNIDLACLDMVYRRWLWNKSKVTIRCPYTKIHPSTQSTATMDRLYDTWLLYYRFGSSVATILALVELL